MNSKRLVSLRPERKVRCVRNRVSSPCYFVGGTYELVDIEFYGPITCYLIRIDEQACLSCLAEDFVILDKETLRHVDVENVDQGGAYV